MDAALRAHETSRRPRRRFRPPYIECADGARLAYRDYGTGAPMLFVAPWASSSGWWDCQITHLTGQALRCITYDRRGHERSSGPGAGYDFDVPADDLAAVIDQLDLRSVVIVGHSLGAAEVVRYLTRHGARRVSRIVLVAPTMPFLVKPVDNPNGLESAMLERALPKITVPALIVHGDSDVSAPIDLTGRRTHALMAGSQLKVYEGAAHGLPVTHMRQLNADLLAFARGEG